MMILDRSHDRRVFFDALTAILAVVGLLVFFVGLLAGGWFKIVGWIFGMGVALIVYGVFIEPRRLVITRYREALVAKPETWIRIVFLSDMHAGAFRFSEWYERLAIEAQAQNPDVLVLGGDYVTDVTAPIKDIAPLSKVKTHLGRYFILGNHDFRDDPALIRRTLKSWGLVDATNRHLTFTKEGRTIQVAFIDDSWHGHPDMELFRAAERLPHLTVTHEPDVVLDLDKKKTDIIICGHTHAGQIRLPAIGALAPLPTNLGRRADRGRKLVNGVPVIISQGCGESDLRARLFAPAEIVVLEVGI